MTIVRNHIAANAREWGCILGVAGVLLAVPAFGADAVEDPAEKKADPAVIQESLRKVKEADEQRKADLVARMPKTMQDRVAYSANADKWDAATCRKQIEVIEARWTQVQSELKNLPQRIADTRRDAVSQDPEIKALEQEIREKQELLKKKMDGLESVKSLETKDQDLRKEQGELVWQKSMLYFRLAKLGQKAVPEDPNKGTTEKVTAAKP
jgi:hypothetical protein